MPAADPHLFLGFRDFEWSAIAALSTALATVIALLLPIAMRWRDRREQQQRADIAIKRAYDMNAQALMVMVNAIGEASQEYRLGIQRYADIASLLIDRLTIASRLATLPDEAVDTSLVAAAGLRMLVAAWDFMRNDQSEEADVVLDDLVSMIFHRPFPEAISRGAWA